MADRRLVALVALLAPALMGLTPGDFASPAPPTVAWPPGPGRDLVTTRCLFCHHAELIVSQRLTPAQWHKEVTKMVKWGAPLEPAEQVVLAEYLAAHYGLEAPAYRPARLTLPQPATQRRR